MFTAAFGDDPEHDQGTKPGKERFHRPLSLIRQLLARSIFVELERHSLAVDVLTQPRHLSHLLTLLGRHPGLDVVIDHASKPDIRTRGFPRGPRISALWHRRHPPGANSPAS
ncbi:amidohydrolase family protein [Roseibium salinum]|uniref:amidohydrolase family protein n=1 Tax=Roseibium salinum TaxID=1604349 RepID=UPI0035E5CE30